MGKKRIALLLAQADEPYQNDFIHGVMEYLLPLGYDVCVFSMYIKYQNSKNREIGESNIYNLVNYDLFDGVIILSDSIQTPGVEKAIQEKVHERFSGPVVCVDTNSEYFYSFWTDGYQAVYDTISHLIEKHGYTDIAYLTGRSTHEHSKRRLSAYKAAMADHGLPIDENRIFYGDFWYTSGIGCAEAILRGKDTLPQVMACANDPMAIGFATEMERQGIKIPENIAVVGYGSSEEGQSSPALLTSTLIPGDYYGRFAAESLIRLKNGEDPGELKPDTELYIGESCGCEAVPPEPKKYRRDSWETKDSDDGFESVHNYFMEDMLLANTPEEFGSALYDHIFHLHEVERLDIFLDERWLDEGQLIENTFSSSGYPRQVINLVKYNTKDPKKNHVGMKDMMLTSELLDFDEDEKAKSYFFTPLFSEEKALGYAVIGYGEKIVAHDRQVRLWMNAVCRGLESLRRNMVIESLLMKSDLKMPGKYPNLVEALSKVKGNVELTPEEADEMQEVEKILNGNLLKYFFQPIVCATDGEIFSYEALMRSATEKFVPPLQIIHYADVLGRISDVEKYTFDNVLKILDGHPDLFNGKKVFINSIPGIKLADRDMETVEDLLVRHADQAVVELTEQAELKDEALDELRERFRGRGIGIAIDDYGTGYSNISNLLRYMPDCVKIDRSLLGEIQNNHKKQHFVRNIIDFCHENKILALAEGVETVEELRTVILLGADLIQGYYVARPAEEVLQSVDSKVRMEISRFHQEMEDGLNNLVYVAGKTNRISLNNLIKENKSTILVGEKGATFRDLTISGTPNSTSGIHIEILEGFDGRITLENVVLTNKKDRPCIHMAENAHLTLRLNGENRFEGGGILVPESSKLTVEGDGNLKIQINGSEIYSIGNAMNKKHGALEFYQDGEICIEASAMTQVGIGSGLGGPIAIHKGRYVFRMNGDDAVCVGSFYGDQPMCIHDCDILMDMSFCTGICVGSMYSSVRLSTWKTLYRCICSGKRISVIGTLDGEKAVISAHDLMFHFNMRADLSTAFGSLTGATDFQLESAAIRYKVAGLKAIVYGGVSEASDVRLDNVDTNIQMMVDEGIITNAPAEHFHRVRSLSDVVINGEVVE